MVSATSPPIERYLPIARNRVQVQQRGRVPKYPSMMVFDSSGICIWQLNSSSFLSVLTMLPPTIRHCSLGQSISKVITWCKLSKVVADPVPFSTSYCSGDLHHSSFSVAAHGHLCRSQHVHPIQRSFTTACGSTAPFLNGQTKDRSSILPDPNGCGISAQSTDDQCTLPDIDHRAMDAHDVDVRHSCQLHFCLH